MFNTDVSQCVDIDHLADFTSVWVIDFTSVWVIVTDVLDKLACHHQPGFDAHRALPLGYTTHPRLGISEARFIRGYFDYMSACQRLPVKLGTVD